MLCNKLYGSFWVVKYITNVTSGCQTRKMLIFGFNWTVFLLVTSIQLIGNGKSVEKYTQCSQSRINKTYKINCSNLNLRSVPKCKSLNVTDCGLITELHLSGNNIQLLRNGSFTQFPNLVYIHLGGNPVKKFESAAFAGLEHLESLKLANIGPAGNKQAIFADEIFVPLIRLKYLNLSDSVVNVQHLFKKVLCGVTSSIDTLIMNHVFHSNTQSSIVVLNSEMSKCFRHMRLKKLFLHNNKIVEIMPDFVIHLRHLEYLSLRLNNIIGSSRAILDLLYDHNLTVLDLGCQNLWQCENYVYPANLPDFKDENIMQSHPTKRNGSKIYFLPNLRTLRLDHVGGQPGPVKIPDICWSNNRLVELDLSYINDHSITGTFECFWNLKFLNIRGTRLTYLDPLIFQDMVSLQVLLLDDVFSSNNMLGKDSSKKFFENNKHLVYLELSHNRIDNLQKEVFKNLNQLRFLNLSYNQIKHINDEFENLTSLEHVDISHNALTRMPIRLLSVFERNMRKNNSIKGIINMVGNPFQCSCTLVSEITRIQMSKVKVTSPNSTQDHLSCILQNGTRITFSQVVEQLISFCHAYSDFTPIVFLTFVYPLCLIVISLSTCGYRYIWWVKYSWYTILHLFYKKKQERRDYIFDAFISYCSEDEDWVRKKLVPNLEKENSKYNLCLHYRHFVPGRNITDNIVAAVQTSRKTVLVVTKKYLKSGWCDFETRFAHTHHLHEQTGGVIGIIHPETFKVRGSRGMGLKRLIDSVTYIKWPLEEEHEGLFWLRLKKALGPPMTASVSTENILLI